MTPAKLPESMIKPEPRSIADTAVGERFVIFSSGMLVDLDRSCYLNGQAILHDGESDLPPLTVTVERREDGFYVIADPKHRWEPHKLQRRENLIPVASITVAQP